MAKITLKQAAAWCGGTVEEKYENVEFLGANNDTRIIKEGQLFIVLQGARDGHDFIPMAIQKGAAAVLCSRKVGDYPAIYVEDPRIALGKIAREELKRIGCKTVGVTGSVGKSTTKEMISTVLESTFRVAKTPANHNNDIGMPMAVLSMPLDTEVAVLEMGMNHFREIAYLSEIAHPDVGVIINVGTMHIEFLGTREGIRKAKMEITEGMAPNAPLLLNGDNDLLRSLDEIPAQPITYFGSDPGCEVWADNVNQGENLTFTAHRGDMDIPVSLALEGEHFVSDALAAISVGLKLNVAPEKISEALAAFRNMAGRQEIFQAGEYTVIKDCYNAGPESMAAALNVLAGRKGRKIAVLGDMLELGESAHPEHYKLGRIAAQKADMVFAYGPYAPRVVDGAVTGGMARENVAAFSDHEALAEALKASAKPGDILLFKGSRGMHMEISLEKFLK
jgi:UDP-N-acetylmuramoyl-tripeptide--D-alanyl-D-alanine ligase